MLTSCPPSTPPVSKAVRRPSRALVKAAVRPANPPPMTTTSYSLLISLSLLRLEARLLDDIAITLPAVADRLPEGRWRACDRLHSELGHRLLHLGRFHRRADGSVGAGDDLGRRCGRRQETRPVLHHDLLEASFKERRNIGRERRALTCRGGENAQLAVTAMRKHFRERRDHRRHMSTKRIH